MYGALMSAEIFAALGNLLHANLHVHWFGSLMHAFNTVTSRCFFFDGFRASRATAPGWRSQ